MEERAKSWVCGQLVQIPKGKAEYLKSVSVEFMICIKAYMHHGNARHILGGALSQRLLLRDS